MYTTGELHSRLLSYTVLFLEKVFTTCLLDAMETFLFPYAILLFLEEIIITCFSVVGEFSLSQLAGIFFLVKLVLFLSYY